MPVLVSAQTSLLWINMLAFIFNGLLQLGRRTSSLPRDRFWTCPTGRRNHGRSRTDLISQLDWNVSASRWRSWRKWVWRVKVYCLNWFVQRSSKQVTENPWTYELQGWISRMSDWPNWPEPMRRRKICMNEAITLIKGIFIWVFK